MKKTCILTLFLLTSLTVFSQKRYYLKHTVPKTTVINSTRINYNNGSIYNVSTVVTRSPGYIKRSITVLPSTTKTSKPYRHYKDLTLVRERAYNNGKTWARSLLYNETPRK